MGLAFAILLGLVLQAWAVDEKAMRAVLREGQEALADFQYGAAVKAGRQLIAMASEHPDVVKFRARLVEKLVEERGDLYKKKKWEKAAQYRTIIAEFDSAQAGRLPLTPAEQQQQFETSHPEYGRRLSAAQEHMTVKRWEDAVREAKAALAMKPPFPAQAQALLARAESSLAQARREAEEARRKATQEAEEARQRAVQEKIGALLPEGRRLRGTKSWAEAESVYEKALALSPGNAEAQEGLARARQERLTAEGVDKALELKRQGKLADALAVCVETLKATGGREEVRLIQEGIVARLLEMAQASFRAGRFGDAATYCHIVRGAYGPANEEARTLMARAESAFREEEAWKTAQALAAAGQWVAAEKSLRAFAAQFPESPRKAEALFGLGQAQNAAKAIKAALASWESVVDQFPDSPWAAEADREIKELTGKSRLATRRPREEAPTASPGPAGPSRVGKEDLWK